VRLADFNGGNLRNAIPREAFGVVVVDKKYRKSLLRFVEQQSEYIKNELALVDNGLTVSIEKTEKPDYVVDRFTQFALINALQACWHGVFAMSAAIPGLVETSTNLASVKFEGKNKIVVTTSQRSSVDSAKRNIAQTVASVFELTGADIKYGKGYPGWQPNPDSDILRVTSAAYQKLFGNEAKIKAIHAGLECGLFLEKYPEMDMISIGPTVKGAHSPDERLNIESVQKFWDLLVEVLAKA
jgi:dipeptidase D